MKSKHLDISFLPVEKLKQKNSNAAFTHRYEFYLLEGAVFARAKPDQNEHQEWSPLLEFKTQLKLPEESYQIIKNNHISAITADESNLILIAENGLVLYAKLDEYEDKIKWIKHWGLLNKFVLKDRELYADTHRYQFISASHSPEHKGRPDGINRVQGCLFGISGLYAFDTQTGYIVYSDPWWRSKFSHFIFPPNGLAIKGMSVSASTIATVTTNNEVYTRLIDIDLGDNIGIRTEYSLEAMDNNLHPEWRGFVDFSSFTPAAPLSYQFIKDIFRTRHLPISLWQNHPIPNDFAISGAITIYQKGPNIRDNFKLRVWGSRGAEYGYITKNLTGAIDSWQFKPQKSEFQPKTQSPLVNAASVPTQRLSGRLGFWGKSEKKAINLTIEAFNPYKDYNRVDLSLGQEHFNLYLFILSQVNFMDRTYSHGTLMLSSELKNAESKRAKRFVRDYFGKEDTQSFLLKRDNDSWSLTAKKLRTDQPTKPLKLSLKADVNEENSIIDPTFSSYS